MSRTRQGIDPPRRKKANGCLNGNHLTARLEEYLLRSSASPPLAREAKAVAADLKVGYSTITTRLRRLQSAGTVYRVHLINPFATRFCHEFRIGIRVDGHRTAKRFGAGCGDAGGSGPDDGRQGGGQVERLIRDVIHRAVKDRQLADHLIVMDAAILLGAHDHDVELSVLTDDGAYSVQRYVSRVLITHPCVITATTAMVAWRWRFDGYSGESANRQNGIAGHTSVCKRTAMPRRQVCAGDPPASRESQANETRIQAREVM